MAIKPTVGGSDGTWGAELNAHLDVSLDTDGKVDDGAAQTSSAAPTADAELANKKYVDDQLAAIVGSLTGGAGSEGEVSIGELQLKWGQKAVVYNVETTITFTSEGLTAFDNACFQVFATYIDPGGTTGWIRTFTLTTTSFKIEHQASGTPTLRWFAIGR